jgi:formylglycine-generating enzyme required for sulfatase activity
MSYIAIGSLTQDLEAPRRVRHISTGIELVLVPSGSFSMGRCIDDKEAFENEPRFDHHSEAFYIGVCPVTQAQYEKEMKMNPAVFRLLPGAAEHPIENIRADEAEEFARRVEMRLPSEIEWEYACRANSAESPTRQPRHGPINSIAWHRGHPDLSGTPTTKPVGRLSANAWGLHDMLGNVWEWTSCYNEQTKKVVVRGGSFMSLSESCRASARFEFFRDHAWRDIGFRLAAGIGDVVPRIEKIGGKLR